MDLRSSGSVLFISCYELGHQPYAVALPLGFLRRLASPPTPGHRHRAARRGKLLAPGSSPSPCRCTLPCALERVAERVRQINPSADICFYGA